MGRRDSGGGERADLGTSERIRLTRALRERQALVDRLTRLQRAIADRQPLEEVLRSAVEGACELLGDDVGVLRRWGEDELEVAIVFGMDEQELAAGHEPGAARIVEFMSLAQPDECVGHRIAPDIRNPSS